jgi:hypothetical protein
MKNTTANGQGQCALEKKLSEVGCYSSRNPAANGPVYFLATMTKGISLGYDMRGDFPAHSRGMRDLEAIRNLKVRLESEWDDLKGNLQIWKTSTFVLDLNADLEFVD